MNTREPAPSIIDFDPTLLAGMRHLFFQPPADVPLDLPSSAGQHRSEQRGGSGGFITHRPYAGGDDLRRIDWPVYARTQRLYTRHFAQQAQQRFVLALDVSASMTFAGLSATPPSSAAPSKLVYCQYLACALTHLIARQQDWPGVALLADGVVQWLAPAATLRHAQQVQQLLSHIQPQPRTCLAIALNELLHRTTRPATLLLMSDFLEEDLDTVMKSLHRFRHAHWRVMVGHVLHPDELSLPGETALELVDLESAQTIRGTPASMRKDYQRRMKTHLDSLEQQTWALGGTYHRWSCDKPWLQGLRTMLEARNL